MHGIFFKLGQVKIQGKFGDEIPKIKISKRKWAPSYFSEKYVIILIYEV